MIDMRKNVLEKLEQVKECLKEIQAQPTSQNNQKLIKAIAALNRAKASEIKIKVGNKVSWSTLDNGTISGTIKEVHTAPIELTIKEQRGAGGEVGEVTLVRNGTEENPALVIRLEGEEEELTLKSASEVRISTGNNPVE